jgi:hypothetical protein
MDNQNRAADKTYFVYILYRLDTESSVSNKQEIKWYPKLKLPCKCQTKMSSWQDTRPLCLKELHCEERRLSTSVNEKPSAG